MKQLTILEQLTIPAIEKVAGIELLAGGALPGLTTIANGPAVGEMLMELAVLH